MIECSGFYRPAVDQAAHGGGVPMRFIEFVEVIRRSQPGTIFVRLNQALEHVDGLSQVRHRQGAAPAMKGVENSRRGHGVAKSVGGFVIAPLHRLRMPYSPFVEGDPDLSLSSREEL